MPVANILGLFLGTRLLLLAGTYLCFILFPVPTHAYPEKQVDVMALLSSWNHWDASHYVEIAQHGYRQMTDVAFFPLFPLLVSGTASLFGHQAYPLAAVLVSNLALLGALFVLYGLAADELNERAGQYTLLYLCLFPTAFFFFAGYNESLFLFFSCATLFALRHQRWWLAGGLGALAALTRSAGALLLLPYLCEVWLTRSESPPGLLRRLAGLLPVVLPALLIPLGTLLYCYYCWKHAGDPLAFASVQRFWGRSLTAPWAGISGSLWQVFRHQPLGSFFEVHVLLDLCATLSFLTLSLLSWRYLRVSYALWISLLALYMLLSSAVSVPDHLVSNQRFVLEMFPGFLVLALLGTRHPRLHLTIVTSFPFLQAIFVALFVLNRWMV